MSNPIPARVTASHDPKPPELPPMPEAILLLAMPGWEDWERTSSGALADMQAEAAGDAANGFATRIITIQPTPAAEPSDAEVAAIPMADEASRLARIKKARDAVCVHVKKWIEANPYIPNCPDDPELAKARMLVAELTLAEQEPPHA